MLYLDSNATTPVLPEVEKAMRPYWGRYFTNPSSPYSPARKPAVALRDAREQVAGAVGADFAEIRFTGCATESNNAVLRGALHSGPPHGELVISAVEHPAVAETALQLEAEGRTVHRVPVDREGRLDMAFLESVLSEKTALLSVMWANNETGIRLPLEACIQLARTRGVPVHTDAVQALGKSALNLHELGVDFASFSAHKVFGPKGVGALYIREGAVLPSWLSGGDQEYGFRAGTENVPGIVGFGRACLLAAEEAAERLEKMKTLRDLFEAELLQLVPGVQIPGRSLERIPNTCMALFPDIEAEALIALLDMEDICCSTGSACNAGSAEPSSVLQAMGYPAEEAGGAVRFSFSHLNSPPEVERVLEVLPALLARSAAVTD